MMRKVIGLPSTEYAVKTGSTDVKIRGITLEKSEIDELLAMLRSGRPEMCHIQYIIEDFITLKCSVV